MLPNGVTIVKELDGKQWGLKYLKKHHFAYLNNIFVLQEEKVEWVWGLGSDGLLYGKGNIENYYNHWTLISFSVHDVPISELKRIVNAFGNLIPFL